MINIAILQTFNLGMKNNNIHNYLNICKKEDVKILLLPEYVLNPFFKELINAPISMINEQSKHYLKLLKKYSKEYEINIIAPLINIKNEKPYKTIVKFSPLSTKYYEQQILINYPHWNEEKFFSNKKLKIKSPLTFKIANFHFAIISSFEIHFDIIFSYLIKKNIDCILVPTSSTFNSKERWRDIIKTRAFLNQTYILRANRIGAYDNKDSKWEFYGDSFLANPFGNISQNLEDKEELAIIKLKKDEINQAKNLFKLKHILRDRI